MKNQKSPARQILFISSGRYCRGWWKVFRSRGFRVPCPRYLSRIDHRIQDCRLAKLWWLVSTTGESFLEKLPVSSACLLYLVYFRCPGRERVVKKKTCALFLNDDQKTVRSCLQVHSLTARSLSREYRESLKVREKDGLVQDSDDSGNGSAKSEAAAPSSDKNGRGNN